uniref:Uncharacterized protein n=1 Tax=Tanacetum cinerariifolium TaxID=118510 RepID=A0A6L2KTD6_TANCI|nr:hypothetical protein [Tanacetum cinerariifolium]
MAGSRRPERPGAPARGSPRFREITRSPEQKTPAKLHGSPVKSHDEKKVDPGMSCSDLFMDWSARKSFGSSIAYEIWIWFIMMNKLIVTDTNILFIIIIK